MTLIPTAETRGHEQSHRVELLDANSIIQRGIRDGLGNIGESATAATLYFIRVKSGFELEAIPEHPDGLCFALKEVYGGGSVVLLRMIMDGIVRAGSWTKRARSSREACERDWHRSSPTRRTRVFLSRSRSR